MNKYEEMAKVHTYKELGYQFLATNDLQLLGGMNFIMSNQDPNWNVSDCYQCRCNLADMGCDVAIVQLGDKKHVYCCVPCRDLKKRINTRRIELLDAMNRY